MNKNTDFKGLFQSIKKLKSDGLTTQQCLVQEISKSTASLSVKDHILSWALVDGPIVICFEVSETRI